MKIMKICRLVVKKREVIEPECQIQVFSTVSKINLNFSVRTVTRTLKNGA